MNEIPMEAKQIEIVGSTVNFYELIKDKTTYYYFDSSFCEAPEPMVNAMLGLQILDSNKKLVMINEKIPSGLFSRIQQNFQYDIEEVEDNKYKIVFSKKEGIKNKTNFSDNYCAG